MNRPEHFYRHHTHTPSETAGRLWFTVMAAGWYLCAPHYRVYRKSLPGYLLGHALRGTGHASLHGKPIDVRRGETFFFDLQREHEYASDERDQWEFLWIHFGGFAAPDYFHLLNAEENPLFRMERPEAMELLFRQALDLFGTNPVGLEPMAHTLITQILTLLVTDKMRAGSVQTANSAVFYPEPVRQGIGFMEENYQTPLQLPDVARKVTLSPFHYARLFKRSTGIPVMEYLLRFRLNKAKYLLHSSDLSIREVAEQSGFADQSYFGKVFKKYERMTPSEFRTHSRRD